MKRQWRVRREVRAVSDGQQRWDRAYQLLLQSPHPAGAPATAMQQTEGVGRASSDLRAGVDAAAGAGADD